MCPANQTHKYITYTNFLMITGSIGMQLQRLGVEELQYNLPNVDILVFMYNARSIFTYLPPQWHISYMCSREYLINASTNESFLLPKIKCFNRNQSENRIYFPKQSTQLEVLVFFFLCILYTRILCKKN